MLYKILLTTLLMLTAFSGRLTAQHVLDARIDSLERLMAQVPPDTRVKLYLDLMPELYARYTLRGNSAADSLHFFRATEDWRTLSKKLNHSFGSGTSLAWEGWFYYFLGNRPRRNELMQQALALVRTANDKRGMANVYYFQGQTVNERGDLIYKMNLYDTAIRYAREAGDSKIELQALRNLAAARLIKGDYATAIKELLQVIELQKGSDSNKIHLTTYKLSQAYAESYNQKEALRYAILSLDYCRKANDTTMIANYYYALGVNYINLGNYEQAFYYFDKVLSSFIVTNNPLIKRVEVATLLQMAKCLVLQNKAEEALRFLSGRFKKYPAAELDEIPELHIEYMDVYCQAKRYREAEKYLLTILRNKDKWRLNEPDISRIFSSAAQMYAGLNQLDKAAYFGDSAYKIALTLKTWDEIEATSLVLFKVDSAKGNYLSAIRHYEESRNASDSLQKELANKHLIELSVQYETDQKNSELAEMANKSKLQQDVIRKGNAFRNAMIAAACLLLLLLLLAFNRYRVKQKANRLMQQKQEEINRQNQVLEKMIDDEKKITAEKDKLLTEKEKLLVEKEWLIKEINHRVKNNLQVVMSLLDTQRIYLKDEAALNAINESQHRLQAISLIHKKLYQSDQLRTVIDMTSYIKEVTEYLSDSLDIDHRIKVDLLLEPVELDVSQAVPIGLIVNESFTNAVKYAFPGGKRGIITIRIEKTPAGEIAMHISDNGTGLPQHFDWQQTDSLGISLMQGLTQQIDGQFELLNKEGLTIKISFKPAKSWE